MKYIVTFSGPVGCSKTPIANYLSGKFNLPIFNTDAIRTEFVEDFFEFNIKKFMKRRNQRLISLFKLGNSFILDASIDREWENYQEEIKNSSYKVYIISLNLSRDFLTKLYQVKNYSDSLKRIDQLLIDHQNFLSKFSSIINLNINDNNFIDRLSLSEKGLTSWLNEN